MIPGPDHESLAAADSWIRLNGGAPIQLGEWSVFPNDMPPFHEWRITKPGVGLLNEKERLRFNEEVGYVETETLVAFWGYFDWRWWRIYEPRLFICHLMRTGLL